MGLLDRGIQIKNPDQVRAMRRAGLLVGETLELLRSSVKAGITTAELDAIAEAHIRGAGGVPSFLGYHGFTGTICTSVNEQVVHGIPGPQVLADGDVISIDCGAIVADDSGQGWHGDAAITVPVGAVSAEITELMRVTEAAMWQGIAAARPGGRVGDISQAVEGYVRSAGSYGIVEDYTGHGIGTEMHQAPDVPNYGRRRGSKLVEGLALAVEPMLTMGAQQTSVLADDWTVITDDGSWAAHFEHTFVLTTGGAWVLTALDGGERELARLGAPFGPLTD